MVGFERAGAGQPTGRVLADGRRAGKRYLTATWPAGDVLAQRTPNDPCNNYGAGFLIDPNPPKLG